RSRGENGPRLSSQESAPPRHPAPGPPGRGAAVCTRRFARRRERDRGGGRDRARAVASSGAEGGRGTGADKDRGGVRAGRVGGTGGGGGAGGLRRGSIPRPFDSANPAAGKETGTGRRRFGVSPIRHRATAQPFGGAERAAIRRAGVQRMDRR